MSGRGLHVAFDVANLSDRALTGIPLYVESLLREYLAAPGPDEWTLFGYDPRTDLPALMTERGIRAERPPRLLPASEYRVGARYPEFAARRPVDWAARKWDGRVALPLGKARTTAALAGTHPDVVHHTGILRVNPGRFRRNAVTIYDLTTRFFPDAHSRVNIAEWERVYAYACDGADLVITDSQSARADVIEHLKVPADRVRAILLGVRPLPPPPPAEARAAVRARFHLGDGPFVLAVGSLDPRKNLPRLIDAFAKLARDPAHADLRLALTGARLHGTDAVEQAVAAHGLSGRVSLTGYVSDAELSALMAECACFAYPSLYEGFGLPVAEALAFGAPVVTSDVSSLPEVAGGAALLVSPQSTEALAEAIGRILTDNSLADDLRRRGRVRAAELTWARCAAEHRRAYRDVAG